MIDYPRDTVPTHHLAPSPRRVRALLAGQVILDTTKARYFWEWSHYPQYYVPTDALTPGVVGEAIGHDATDFGEVTIHDVTAGGVTRAGAAEVVTRSVVPGLTGLVRLHFADMDAWFEEDEEIFVHPRSPFCRVDAVRSTRAVRIERDGIVLAQSPSPVAVFETGLPTRWYVEKSNVNFEHLVASQTRTACPYKGRTTGYWSVRTPVATYEDIAWSYDFPTAALLPVLGLVAFLNEKVDVFLDGELAARPVTHMS